MISNNLDVLLNAIGICCGIIEFVDIRLRIIIFFWIDVFSKQNKLGAVR